jgi:predicted anti-sigma-YlaC factor YlaD
MQTKQGKTDCTFVRKNIFSYIEEDLPGEIRHDVEEHLHSCKECSGIVSEFQSLSSLITKTKAAEPNPFTVTRILQRIETEIAEHSNEPRTFLFRVIRPISFSFMFILAIVIGFALGKQNGTSFSNAKNTPNDLQTLKSDLNIPDFIDEENIISDNY